MIQAREEGAAGPGDASQPRNLAEWVEVLSERGMPVFAHTVEQISGVASDCESSAGELAGIVLQDAAMTARLLRVANSPMYNLSGRSISTVSRAVVMLGFDAVRSLCLSIAVVEAVARGSCKARLAEDMARSFHAAVQARAFAERRGDSSPEEIFIATLLYNLGRLAFWSHGSDAAGELDKLLQRPGMDEDQAIRERLGFDLNELTLGLSRRWRLGEVLEHALEGKTDDDPRVSNVALAHELAREVEAGWEAPRVKALMSRIAENLYLPLEDVRDMVQENAREAARTAACFGAGDAARLIPLPAGRTGSLERVEAGPDAQEFPEPDPDLQLRILRELSGMLEGRCDINLLLEMVLEGIYRGVGMDRALFALLNTDRTLVRARYALGWNQTDMRDRFIFPVSPVKANIFFHVLDQREAVWLHPDADSGLLSLVTDEVRETLGEHPFFAMPIEIQGKAIGLFYADRAPSGRPLGEDDYGAFRHFGNQANMALAYLRGK
ncbi:MAG TPA: HDOD domain-containing protein [Thiotrichales bacterium]|nr:HDOD domain-containing protein [Thiotrichales bacterium]